MSTSPVSATADRRETLAAVVRLLGVAGLRAIPDVVRKTHAGLLATDSLVLRRWEGGQVLGSAQRQRQRPDDVAPRPPMDDQWVLEVPVRARSATWGLLTAVSAAPLPAVDAELLTAVAGVIGLAVAAEASYDVGLAAQAVLDGEADRAQLAAEIDDRLGEALVALGHMPADRLPEAIGAALAVVRDLRRDLSAMSLQGGLRPALRDLRGSGARVHAEDPALDGVPPAVAVVVERVAELACRSAIGNTQITAFVDGTTVKLRVESADNTSDASELERWARRARALGGDLRRQPGRVELSVPASSSEGRHDDGADL